MDRGDGTTAWFGTGERRLFQRYGVGLAARLAAGGRVVDAVVTDLSLEGAALRLDAEALAQVACLAAGTSVRLGCPAIGAGELEGVVRGVEDDVLRLGLALDPYGEDRLIMFLVACPRTALPGGADRAGAGATTVAELAQ